MSGEKGYNRFSVSQRIEHIALVLSFSTLGLTGLIQKYAAFGISDALIVFLGGIENVRIIHRVAAVMFLVESVYHLVVIGYKMFVLRLEASMLPGLKDVRDAIQALFYNIGLGKTRPKMGRYNFVEKAEYWAMLWGLMVMAVTGFMLWNPIATTRALPGQFVPAAKVAHGGEAVLAVLAIIIWHFYSVHLKKLNLSMLTGKLSREEMEEEHALELEAIEAGKIAERPAPAVLRKRMIWFSPVAAALSLLLVYGIYVFVTYEDTAITTIPPVEKPVEVFSTREPTPLPQLAPEATTEPGESVVGATPLSWNGEIGVLFEQRCGMCHGPAGGLNLTSLDGLLAGGESGPAVVSGDPEAGTIMISQTSGSHPGQFLPEELARVNEWVAAGLPEK
ncbi:MAG: hypothetical protein HPY76_02220 [Anaerolineae bacterium]|nr:hypothetical protein [Anaerolineae bacterium]